MLQIEAKVVSDAAGESRSGVQVTLRTGDRTQPLILPQKSDGRGLATNGGELLCLALATCFCNDLYREAMPRNISLGRIEVTVRSVFGGIGEAARELAYSVRVSGAAHESELRALIQHTDRVAEVHNTLRRGMPVLLEHVEVHDTAARRPDGAADVERRPTLL